MSSPSSTPALGDLATIFAANAAQLAQATIAGATAMLRMTEGIAANIQAQSAYGLQVDNRLVTGAVAAQIAAAGEPDAFAGINAGVRTPITLDQPGNWPTASQVKAPA